jgi:hypothetical protein
MNWTVKQVRQHARRSIKNTLRPSKLTQGKRTSFKTTVRSNPQTLGAFAIVIFRYNSNAFVVSYVTTSLLYFLLSRIYSEIRV